MGREKGTRETIFPCLVGEKMGEERKWGRKIVWALCPIFPPTFSSQNGGIMGQICYPTLCPYHILIVPLLHSSPNSILHCIRPFLLCFLSIHNTRASLISPFLLIILSNQLSCSLLLRLTICN